MGQRFSREEETPEHPLEEKQDGGFFGWLFSPGTGDKRPRTRDHVDEPERGLPATKKARTEETAVNDDSSLSKSRFLASHSKPACAGQMLGLNAAILKDGCIPKAPLAPFIAFSIDRRPELKRQNPNVRGVQLSIMLGEEWRASAQLRQEYGDRHRKLKAEYEAKMEEMGMSLPKIDQKKGGKRVIDGRPKRPMSAYCLFKREQRPILKREHPGADTQEIKTMLWQRWKHLSGELREQYMMQHRKLLDAFHQEMAKLRAVQAQSRCDEGNIASELVSSQKQQSVSNQVTNYGETTASESPLELPPKTAAPQVPSSATPTSPTAAASLAPKPSAEVTKSPSKQLPAKQPTNHIAPPKKLAKLPAAGTMSSKGQLASSASSSKCPAQPPAMSANNSRILANQAATSAAAPRNPSTQKSESVATPQSPAKPQIESPMTGKAQAKQSHDCAEAVPIRGGKPHAVHPGKAAALKEMTSGSSPVASVFPASHQQTTARAVPPPFYNYSAYPYPYGYTPYTGYYSYSYGPPQQPPGLPHSPAPIVHRPNEPTGGNNGTRSVATCPTKVSKRTDDV